MVQRRRNEMKFKKLYQDHLEGYFKVIDILNGII